jgi:O-antigen/teichoic acid export membrane protein
MAEAAVGLAAAILTTFIVARLIGPAGTGLAALAATVVMLVQPVAAYAFTTAMVQRARLEAEDISTVLWASLTLASAMALMIGIAGLTLGDWLPAGLGGHSYPCLRSCFR